MTCPDAELLAAGDRSIAAHLASCSDCARIAAAIAADDDSGAEPSAVSDEPALGEALGRYILVAHLGSGGMGVVAAAYDPQLDRNVAIKWIRADRATPDFARRFEREAQTLARLVHPNVVRVYDAGIAGGRPFLAMELVDGLTLRAWLASEPRSTEDIVHVFIEVARGLAAVHEAGWVHRDVKPDNILVDRAGTARLADFGLASAIDSASANGLHGSSPSAASSNALAAAGTPAYMAPEQCDGTRDSRSDQWSWGTSLAEALDGSTSSVGERGEHGNTERGSAERGSAERSTAERAVSSRVRTVIARATSVDPEARFATMTDAADALVAAIAPATARSRWWPIAAIGAIAIGGAITALAIARSSSEVDSCLADAQMLARDWDATQTAVLASFAATGHPAWRARLESTAQSARAIATQWADASLVTCRAHGRAPRVASAQASSPENSIAASGATSSPPGATQPTSRATSSRSGATQPTSRATSSRPGAAQQACLAQQRDAARALFVELAHADRALVDQAPIAVSRLSRAELCADANVVERVHAAAAIEAPLAARLASLQARAALRKPAAIAQNLAQLAEDARAANAPQLEAEAKLLLGEMYSRLRDDAKARIVLEEAAQAAARAKDDRVAALARLLQAGQAALQTAKREEAETLANVARAAVERAGSPAELRAQLENVLGGLAWASGDYATALAHYQASVTARSEAFGADDPRVAAAHQNVGGTLRKLGKNDEARVAHETALAILEKSLGPDHPDLANTVSSLGMLAADEQRFDDARAYLERARELRIASVGPDHPDIATSENNLGKLAKLRGDLPAARAHFERSLEIQAAKFGADAVELALPLSGLGGVLGDMALWPEARRHLERAIAINEAHRGKDHPALISMLFTLANVRGHQGDHVAERALLERARAIATTKLGADHPQTKDAASRLAAVK